MPSWHILYFVEDIILGIVGPKIVATALTYISNRGSPVAEDLPWAGTISDDVMVLHVYAFQVGFRPFLVPLPLS